MDILITLPGFGKILSALAALEIDDINRFSTPAKCASYSTLIPSTFASGGKVYHGGYSGETCHLFWLKVYH